MWHRKTYKEHINNIYIYYFQVPTEAPRAAAEQDEFTANRVLSCEIWTVCCAKSQLISGWQICIYIYIRIYIYIDVYIMIYICMCVCIYIYINTLYKHSIRFSSWFFCHDLISYFHRVSRLPRGTSFAVQPRPGHLRNQRLPRSSIKVKDTIGIDRQS